MDLDDVRQHLAVALEENDWDAIVHEDALTVPSWRETASELAEGLRKRDWKHVVDAARELEGLRQRVRHRPHAGPIYPPPSDLDPPQDADWLELCTLEHSVRRAIRVLASFGRWDTPAEMVELDSAVPRTPHHWHEETGTWVELPLPDGWSADPEAEFRN